MSTTAPITLAIHAVGTDTRTQLADEVRSGLGRAPKELPPRWFYDARGSELFDRITELPEYYQMRTEASILRGSADAIARRARPETIVELGAGSCVKSRILIDAARRQGALSRFVPFDVSESTVQRSARELVDEFEGLFVYGMVGDFASHLVAIPRFGRQLIVFLGGTLGNLLPDERAAFLDAVRSLLRPGDGFLLGIDLVKDRDELIAAYDDAQGVTAEFNRNVLHVINDQLDADFDVAAFDHLAVFDEQLSRIEMHLRAQRHMVVRIPGADLTVELAEGETIRTEISAKFTRESAEIFLTEARLPVAEWFTDPRQRFALVLAEPAGSHGA